MLKIDPTNIIMKSKDCCQKAKTKKVIELMKDELGGKIMTEFVWIRPKTYYQFINDSSGDKKVRGIKKYKAKV